MRMNKKLHHLLLALLFAACVLGARIAATAQQASDPLSVLPTSDVVMFVDLRRIMTEIVPRVLMKDPATLAKMTNALNELNTKTGFNILSIDRIAAGLQFVGPVKHNFRKEDMGIAIIVRGDFDADRIVAFLKKESKGKGSEETYGGKVIYVEPRPNPPAKKSDREVAALSIPDDHTVIFGDLPQVRAALDAAAGKGRVDAALTGLATRDANAFVGLAGNVPSELIQDLKDTAPAEETAQAIVKIILNIKQIFASFGSTATDFDLTTGARMATPEQAQSVSDMLIGLRQQVGGQMDDQKLRELLNTLQITAQGEEVQLKASVKNEVVQDFVTSMVKEETKEAKKTSTAVTGKAKTTPKSRRGRRRKRH